VAARAGAAGRLRGARRMRAEAAAPVRSRLRQQPGARVERIQPAPTQPPATREQILAIAARLFSEHGYANTTLRQIAQEAGIQAGSIYYHFEGKDEIAACVLDEGIAAVTDAVQRRLAALPPGADTRTRLGAAVEGHLWGMLQRGEFTAAHIRIYRYVSDAARQRHRSIRSAYTQLWDELLQQAADAGQLRRDIPVAMVRQFLVGALNWPVDWYDPRRGSFEQLAAQLTALALDGMTVPAPKAARKGRAR
jgi:TetR/AcrR family transcriptional regulator, cholesterol catabolism regulator